MSLEQHHKQRRERSSWRTALKLAGRRLAAAALALGLAALPAAAKPAAPAHAGAHPTTPVIESIAWREVGLVIQATAPLQPDIFTLEKPDRFVIDLPGAELAEPSLAQALHVNTHGIKGVRLARQPGGSLRLVLDCTIAPRFQVMQLAGRTAIVVAQAGESGAALAALVEGKGLGYTGSGQFLRSLIAREHGESVELELAAAKPLAYSLFQEDLTHLQIEIPQGHFTGLLPLPGKLLERAHAHTLPDGTWVLDAAVAPGVYQLDQGLNKDKSSLVLAWRKLDPHRFPGRPLVLIDPGHGGADPGALGPAGGLEKQDCLALALALQRVLEAKQINAVLTRSADTELYLEPRLRLIDQLGADLFVSLHANSHGVASSAGTEAFWREPASRAFATAIQAAVMGQLHRQDRGVKQEKLYVLRNTHVPSVLLETGFISNPGEEKLLASHEFQGRAAAAIAAGVESYLALDHGVAAGPKPAAPGRVGRTLAASAR